MTQPITHSWLIRLLAVVVVLLAMAAGYYQALYHTEQLKYERLELEYQKAIGENR